VSTVAGKVVLVTGAGGFIGGHLTAALVDQGAKVRALVRYNSRSDPGTLGWFDPPILADVELVFGDLRDLESVTGATRGAELVFHVGAQIAIPYSYANPRDFFETNVLGSLNVAQAALQDGVGHLVHVSSSEVYGTPGRVPITEEHALQAQSPYAASKLGADKLMDSFYRTYALPVTIVRPFNTYGPHQSARAIVPTIVSQALASNTLALGTLTPRRDLTYVSDTVAGLIAAAAAPGSIGHTVQLGTGRDASVAELVELVGEILGRTLDVARDPQRIRPAASEVEQLLSDPALARTMIGWQATVDLRTGLSETIAWIAANTERFRNERYET
jgi:NAD dependent epimerase/dehydratase